jgi:hypothetical protein
MFGFIRQFDKICDRTRPDSVLTYAKARFDRVVEQMNSTLLNSTF